MVTQQTKCSKCGETLDESPELASTDRPPCPNCGSVGRQYAVGVSGSVSIKSRLGAKAYEPRRKDPFLEHKEGDSFFRTAAKWVTRMMRINRRDDRYTEHVFDPKTGETIHQCDEPLSEQKSHGSAKKRR